MPIGLAAVVLTRAVRARVARAARPRGLDPVGQVLVIVALASLTYAIIEAPGAGWSSAQTSALFALSALALAGVVAYEPRREDPLIELRFFRSAPFSGATLIAVSAFAGFSGFLFINTLYLQDVARLLGAGGRAVHAADGAGARWSAAHCRDGSSAAAGRACRCSSPALHDRQRRRADHALAGAHR